MMGNVRKRVLRGAVLLSLLMAGAGALMSAGTMLQDLSTRLDTLFAVFRVASQLNVDGVSSERLMEGAINGMMSRLDPYARYTSKEERSDLVFEATGG